MVFAFGWFAKKAKPSSPPYSSVVCIYTTTAVDMMSAVVKDLCKLENRVEMFDAMFNQNVFVIAPVLVILCDNPRASKILGHMTREPIMFCKVCKVCTDI